MTTAERLRRIRQMAQMSQYDVAKKTRISRSRVSEIENGHVQPSADEIAAFEQACIGKVRKHVTDVAEMLQASA